MDDKKKHILTAAEGIFARFGFKKATMDDIAGKAHIGKSTLYYYFKNKQEIMAEVIRLDTRKFRQKLTEAIERAETPQEKINDYVLARMKYLQELTNYYTTLTDEYLDHYSFAEEIRKDFNRYELESLMGLLREGSDRGVFQLEDIEATARMIAIAIKGLEYRFLVEGDSDHMEDISKQMLHVFFQGIAVA